MGRGGEELTCAVVGDSGEGLGWQGGGLFVVQRGLGRGVLKVPGVREGLLGRPNHSRLYSGLLST